MACMAFYERGFSAPPHQFLYSLLWSYGLELHHWTPSGILYMASFVNLCEAIIGIELRFNQWSYFFRALLQQGSDTGAVALRSVDISVRCRPNIDPYFSIPLPDPLVGLRKAWFLLKNDANALLPAFTGGRPISHTNWEYGVAWADLQRLQPLLEIIWGLLQGGLTCQKILWIFAVTGFSCFVNER
jgi:hypothetical protein